MRSTQNNRFWQVMIGLFVLLIGLTAVASQALPAMLLIGLGGYLLWRQFENNSSVSAPRSDYSYEYEFDETPSEIRQSGAEKVYAHALKAVEQAGLNPEQVRVLPVDIGVMAFKGDQDPVVYRTLSITDDVDYIQPFVQLRLPQKAIGRIKFEIIDSDGQVLFIREENHQLERGRNLVTPSARLPIHDAQAMFKDWQLRISADGMPLATHTFGWQESDTRRVRRNLTEDGEISNELRATLAENRLQKMSLDELLSSQADDEQPRQQRR